MDQQTPTSCTDAFSAQAVANETKAWDRIQVFEREMGITLQSRIRRRRSLISAWGWSAATTLGIQIQCRLTLERVRRERNPFRVVSHFIYLYPSVVAALQRWAGIGERLRHSVFTNNALFCRTVAVANRSHNLEVLLCD